MKNVVKKWSIVLSTVVVSSALLAGCMGEPTLQEVINKNTEATKKQTGSVIEVKGKHRLIIPNMGIDQDQDLDFKIEATSKPMAVHMNGSLKLMGQNLGMEIYTLDKEAYAKVSGIPNMPKSENNWVKFPGPSSDFDSSKAEKFIDEFNKSFATFEKDAGAYTMKKEKDTYVITLDSSKIKDPNKLKEVSRTLITKLTEMNGLTSEEKSTFESSINQIWKDFKIVNLKRVTTIDAKTFEVKKSSLKMKLSVNVDGQEITSDLDLNSESKGAPTSPIKIPEDVKKNAKDMDKMMPGLLEEAPLPATDNKKK